MDTCHKRRLPGEGVLDVKGFIKAVQATVFGYPGSAADVASRSSAYPE